jgi:hypothetical protein
MRRRVLQHASIGVSIAAVFAGYAYYTDHMALVRAQRFCAMAAVEPEVEKLMTPPQLPLDVPFMVNGIPCRVTGGKLHFSFSGLAGYSATCVVTRDGGEVTATAVVEGR